MKVAEWSSLHDLTEREENRKGMRCKQYSQTKAVKATQFDTFIIRSLLAREMHAAPHKDAGYEFPQVGCTAYVLYSHVVELLYARWTLDFVGHEVINTCT